MPRQPFKRRRLTASRSQPLLGLLVEEDGQEIVRYFVGDVSESSDVPEATTADALSLAGA
jgi:hypothetical protein